MALLANLHRDPKKSKVFKPSDFHPYSRGHSGETLPADISVLKQVFLPEN